MQSLISRSSTWKCSVTGKCPLSANLSAKIIQHFLKLPKHMTASMAFMLQISATCTAFAVLCLNSADQLKVEPTGQVHLPVQYM
jgi:hypothetical protein